MEKKVDMCDQTTRVWTCRVGLSRMRRIVPYDVSNMDILFLTGERNGHVDICHKSQNRRQNV